MANMEQALDHLRNAYTEIAAAMFLLNTDSSSLVGEAWVIVGSLIRGMESDVEEQENIAERVEEYRNNAT